MEDIEMIDFGNKGPVPISIGGEIPVWDFCIKNNDEEFWWDDLLIDKILYRKKGEDWINIYPSDPEFKRCLSLISADCRETLRAMLEIYWKSQI